MYTIMDVIYDEPMCRILVASDAVDLREDPTAVDGIWYVSRETADKLCVGDYVNLFGRKFN